MATPSTALALLAETTAPSMLATMEILLAALLGWWVAGLVPATAALFGAVSAPTDPVQGKDQGH